MDIFYATQDGHSKRLAERLALQARANGVVVVLHNLAESLAFPPGQGPVVVVAPIRMGYHLPAAEAFLRAHKNALGGRPLAMVSLNLTARKPGKDSVSGNPYLRKWVRRHGVRPTLMAAFAGKIDYKLYKTWEKYAVRLIMWMTRGPTSFDAEVDFTPWARVDAFGRALAALALGDLPALGGLEGEAWVCASLPETGLPREARS